ncbi:sigma-70 family RNA polymerase sigma factor [Candidatus Poribacteria bacterium]|nr:sigma-70 family RNA polymerase sigma factor [Candidatus Poribacteria bacterium]
MSEQQKVMETYQTESASVEQDFVVIMQQNQDYIYHLAFNLLNDKEEAKDAVQEVFLKAWKKIDMLRWNTSKAWLTRVAVNHCLDKIRRRRFRINFHKEPDEIIESLLPSSDTDPLKNCLSKEAQQEVRKAIAKLRPSYRAVLVLRDLEEMSYPEIADILNIKISEVKSNLFRGRKKLKKFLRPYLR